NGDDRLELSADDGEFGIVKLTSSSLAFPFSHRWNSSFDSEEQSKIEFLTGLEIIVHDCRACIYRAFVSVNTYDIPTNNEFPIFDIWEKIFTEDDALVGVILVNVLVLLWSGFIIPSIVEPTNL
ncbi:hypothetical protein Tco_1450148, partial [Tanacetum coccineum]